MATPFDPEAKKEDGTLDPSAVGGKTLGASHEERHFSNYHIQDFESQEALVEIVPKFTLPVVEGIAGSYGPFSPNYPIIVPLWLALFLRQTNTCTITPPPFMEVDFLSEVLQKELESDGDFQPLHFHFFEIVRQLVKNAPHDVPNCGEVQRLVDQIRTRREGKIRNSLGMFEKDSLQNTGIRVSNLIALEVEYLRASLARVLDDGVELDRRSQPMQGAVTTPFASTSASIPSASQTTYTTATTGRPSDATTLYASTEGGDVATTADGSSQPQRPVVEREAREEVEPQQAAPRKRRTLRQK